MRHGHSLLLRRRALGKSAGGSATKEASVLADRSQGLKERLPWAVCAGSKSPSHFLEAKGQ